MNALEILIAEVEHTAQLALSDGSEVTKSKLNAHILQYREAMSDEDMDISDAPYYCNCDKPGCKGESY